MIAGPVVASVVNEDLLACTDVAGGDDPETSLVDEKGGVLAIFVEWVVDVPGKTEYDTGNGVEGVYPCKFVWFNWLSCDQ